MESKIDPEYLTQLATEHGLKTISVGSIHIELSEQALNAWFLKQRNSLEVEAIEESVEESEDKLLFHSVS